MDGGKLDRARVDGLAAQRERVSLIPLRNFVLAQLVVRQVGIEAQLVRFGETLPRRSGRRARWAGDQAGKPLRRLAVDVPVDEIDLRRVEPLQRNPDPCRGVDRQHAAAQVFEERQHQFGWIISGIAARKEDAGHRAVPEQLFALIEQFRALGCVVEIELGRQPEPVVQTIPVADLADRLVHLAPANLHDRSGPRILERNALDAVDAEKSQFADILLELCGVPGIVRICLCPIAELMATDGICGSSRDIDRSAKPQVAL